MEISPRAVLPRKERRMSEIKLKPCRICRKSNVIIETWTSGGRMYMVKCNNPDCPVPERGFPTGRNLDEVKAEWNRRADKVIEIVKKGGIE